MSDQPSPFLRAARELSAAFERVNRPDGETYVRLKPGSPDWMTAAVRSAHGGVLPDDAIYSRCEDVADAIAEADAEDADAAREACDQIEPDCYYSDLTAWLASCPNALALCDQAREEGLVAESASMSDRIQAGQLQQIREIAGEIIQALEERAEEIEDEDAASEGAE